jgi:hypothetical protein
VPFAADVDDHPLAWMFWGGCALILGAVNSDGESIAPAA